MVQKSYVHQLRLVVYPIYIYLSCYVQGFIHPEVGSFILLFTGFKHHARWLARFLPSTVFSDSLMVKSTKTYMQPTKALSTVAGQLPEKQQIHICMAHNYPVYIHMYIYIYVYMFFFFGDILYMYTMKLYTYVFVCVLYTLPKFCEKKNVLLKHKLGLESHRDSNPFRTPPNK